MEIDQKEVPQESNGPRNGLSRDKKCRDSIPSAVVWTAGISPWFVVPKLYFMTPYGFQMTFDDGYDWNQKCGTSSMDVK